MRNVAAVPATEGWLKRVARGVVGIDPGNTVAVSARFVGRGRAAEVLVLDMLGRPLHEHSAAMTRRRRRM